MSGAAPVPPRRAWPLLKKTAGWALGVLVVGLLASQAHRVEWGTVFEALRALPVSALWGAAGLTVLSYVIYSTFDLVGRAYAGHTLPARQVLAVSFTSYAFNLNLGALLGGIAFRYRLYGRLGLSLSTITRVLSACLVTNWLGYLLVAGVAFLWVPLSLPPQWKIDLTGLRVLGGVMAGAALVFLGLCALASRRAWRVRGHTVELPAARLAVVQVALGSANWLSMASIVFVLLQQRIEYPQVLAALLVGAVAGALAHVPAGLGVLEAVFLALLSRQVPAHELLAALLAYRAIYYLAPLAFAAVAYAVMEWRSRRGAVARRGPRKT